MTPQGYDTPLIWHLSDMTPQWYDILVIRHRSNMTIKGYDIPTMWRPSDMTLQWYDAPVIWHPCDMTPHWHDATMTWHPSDMTLQWCDIAPSDMTPHIFKHEPRFESMSPASTSPPYTILRPSTSETHIALYCKIHNTIVPITWNELCNATVSLTLCAHN